ncbi:MAG: ATP-binding cassette domain-containing protein, partial [Chitinophagales bacterium]
ISIVLPGRAEAVQVLSVSEILFFARAPYTGYLHKLQKTDFEIVENIIEQLEISTLIKKKLYQLSDGETQKVFLAKALVQDTPVLFLDEPTSHLDIINRIEIFRMIGKLAKQQNKTILFASHELDLSLQIADVCLLFNKKGQVVFGKTEELIEQNRIEDFLLEGKYQFNKKLRSVEIKL